MNTKAYDKYIDIEFNPFIDWSNHGVEQRPATWVTDDIACTRVLTYLQRKLDQTKFKLTHPPLMYSDDQRYAYIERLNRRVLYWESRIADAKYN